MITEILLWFSLIIFSISALLTLLRALATQNFLERIICLELVGMIVCGILVVYAAIFQRIDLLDSVLLLGFVSYMSTYGLVFYFKSQKDFDHRKWLRNRKWK